MTERIPTTWNLTQEDANNIYKLFDTWSNEKNKNKWENRKKKILTIINGRLGWAIALLQFLNELRKLYS